MSLINPRRIKVLFNADDSKEMPIYPNQTQTSFNINYFPRSCDSEKLLGWFLLYFWELRIPHNTHMNIQRFFQKFSSHKTGTIMQNSLVYKRTIIKLISLDGKFFFKIRITFLKFTFRKMVPVTVLREDQVFTLQSYLERNAGPSWKDMVSQSQYL